MRIRGGAALVMAGAISVGAGGLGAAAAHADAAPLCMGQAATLVSSDAVITGTTGNDVIVVQQADPDHPVAHTIVWTGGSDVVCGTGNDIVDYSQAADAHAGPVVAHLHGNTGSAVNHRQRKVESAGFNKKHKPITIVTWVGDKGRDRLTGVPNVIGSMYKDRLVTYADGATAQGMAGDDTLVAFGKGARLDGGDGNDHLVPFDKADTAIGAPARTGARSGSTDSATTGSRPAPLTTQTHDRASAAQLRALARSRTAP